MVACTTVPRGNGPLGEVSEIISFIQRDGENFDSAIQYYSVFWTETLHLFTFTKLNFENRMSLECTIYSFKFDASLKITFHFEQQISNSS